MHGERHRDQNTGLDGLLLTGRRDEFSVLRGCLATVTTPPVGLNRLMHTEAQFALQTTDAGLATPSLAGHPPKPDWRPDAEMRVHYPNDYAGPDGAKAGRAHLLAACMTRKAVSITAEAAPTAAEIKPQLDQLVSDLTAIEAIPSLQLMPTAGLE